MSNETNRSRTVKAISCPDCWTEYSTFPEFMEHVQRTMNLGTAQLPIEPDHNHEFCICESCIALRGLYPLIASLKA